MEKRYKATIRRGKFNGFNYCFTFMKMFNNHFGVLFYTSDWNEIAKSISSFLAEEPELSFRSIEWIDTPLDDVYTLKNIFTKSKEPKMQSVCIEQASLF